MDQRSLVLIKPDGVQRNLIGEIIKRLEDGGLKIEALEMVEPIDDIVNRHYPLDNRDYILTLGHTDITGKSEEEIEAIYQKNYKIIKGLHEYVKSGPIVKMIIGGTEDTIQKVRDITGKTDPAKSPEGSIRGDLGIDSFEAADKEERSVRNLIHASGNPEEAETEITLWFGENPKILR